MTVTLYVINLYSMIFTLFNRIKLLFDDDNDFCLNVMLIYTVSTQTDVKNKMLLIKGYQNRIKDIVVILIVLQQNKF